MKLFVICFDLKGGWPGPSPTTALRLKIKILRKYCSCKAGCFSYSSFFWRGRGMGPLNYFKKLIFGPTNPHPQEPKEERGGRV